MEIVVYVYVGGLILLGLMYLWIRRYLNHMLGFYPEDEAIIAVKHIVLKPAAKNCLSWPWQVCFVLSLALSGKLKD